MANSTEVERFLIEFKIKMNFRGIYFRIDRMKNRLTLSDLDLTISLCKEILNDLVIEDYSDGPIKDTLHNELPMWVFGKIVRNQEIYIKITHGRFNEQPVCVSFHKSNQPMKYPLKR